MDQHFLPPSIINYLKALNPNELENNYLEGILYKYHSEILSPNQIENYGRLWRSRWNKNLVFENTLKELANDFKQINARIIILKGMALLNDLYPDSGSRTMSDIDLLIYSHSLEEIIPIFTGKGFHVVNEKKWKGNAHKKTFENNIEGIPVIIEVHSKLFYHIKDPTYNTGSWKISPYQILSKEMTLIHLVGHAAFQHSFLKFFWLIDIFQFIKTNGHKLNWNKLFELADYYCFLNSFKMIFYILE